MVPRRPPKDDAQAGANMPGPPLDDGGRTDAREPREDDDRNSRDKSPDADSDDSDLGHLNAHDALSPSRRLVLVRAAHVRQAPSPWVDETWDEDPVRPRLRRDRPTDMWSDGGPKPPWPLLMSLLP